MILGFHPQFVTPILSEVKIHSLREDEHKRWKIGMAMQMATGVRSKNYKCFKEDTCKHIQRVFMSYDHMLHISIDNASGNFAFEELYYPEKLILAKNDGFLTYEDFELWFINVLKKKKDKCASFRLLHWTDFKY